MQKITEIKDLLRIISKLQNKYKNRQFTLDGRLVGDIGEIIVEKNYNVNLYPKQMSKYDGHSGKKQVQIKATLKNSLTFPLEYENVPEYYIGIKLFSDGSFEEIYNGLGKKIYDVLKHRKKTKIGYTSISISTLRNINIQIPEKYKIKRRISVKSNGT